MTGVLRHQTPKENKNFKHSHHPSFSTFPHRGRLLQGHRACLSPVSLWSFIVSHWCMAKNTPMKNVNFYIDARSVFLLNDCFCSKLQYCPADSALFKRHEAAEKIVHFPGESRIDFNDQNIGSFRMLQKSALPSFFSQWKIV